YAIVHRMPIRPSALASLPRDVDRWFALALAKSPDARFASGAALVSALEAALRGELDGKLRGRADIAIRAHPWEAAGRSPRRCCPAPAAGWPARRSGGPERSCASAGRSRSVS